MNTEKQITLTDEQLDLLIDCITTVIDLEDGGEDLKLDSLFDLRNILLKEISWVVNKNE